MFKIKRAEPGERLIDKIDEFLFEWFLDHFDYDFFINKFFRWRLISRLPDRAVMSMLEGIQRGYPADMFADMTPIEEGKKDNVPDTHA